MFFLEDVFFRKLLTLIIIIIMIISISIIIIIIIIIIITVVVHWDISELRIYWQGVRFFGEFKNTIHEIR